MPQAHLPSNPGASTGKSPQSPIMALDALEQWRVHDEQTAQQRVYWPLDKMPLTVRLMPPETGNAGMSQAECMTVMRQWEAASQGLVRFQLVELTAESPDILIEWRQETVLGRDFEVGHTKREVNGKHITHATITLIVNPLIDGHLSPQRQRQRLYATLLHETGHALGLEHSESKQDVMHHRGWQRPYLSQGDIQRIQHHYGQRQALQF